MKDSREKIVISLAIFIIIGAIIFSPKPAKAVVPTWDGFVLTETIANFVETIIRWEFEDAMKALRDTIAKQLMDYVGDQVLTWVQGGGEPQFVGDWEGFLKNAGMIAISTVVDDIYGADICSPFKAQVQRYVVPQNPQAQAYSQRIECTLDDVVNNIEAFYEDPYNNGGIEAYNISLEPQNNFFGQILMAHDEALFRSGAEIEGAKNEAVAGGGFLSSFECLEHNSLGECIKKQITTPAKTVADTVSRVVTSDLEWSANIESWLSVLVNSVVDRLINEGLGLMGTSDSPGQTSYTPPSGGGPGGYYTSQASMVADLRSYINEWSYVRSAKQRSLSYSQQERVYLNRIDANPFCSPPITTEITATTSDINFFQFQIAGISAMITDANNLITQINNASTNSEIAAAQQDFFQFQIRYNTAEVEAQIITGSGRSFADQEAINKQTELTDAQTRSNNCGTGGGVIIL